MASSSSSAPSCPVPVPGTGTITVPVQSHPLPIPVSIPNTPVPVPGPVPGTVPVPVQSHPLPIPVSVPNTVPVQVPGPVPGTVTVPVQSHRLLIPVSVPNTVPVNSQPQVPVPAPVPHQPTPPHLTYKNRLQEFVLKSKIAHPVYQTVNEGGVHAPKFRSTLWLGDTSYTSPTLFFQRKAAEQEVARIALESLLERTRDEGRSIASEVLRNKIEIPPFSKSIINEYAAKLHVVKPTYNTVQLQLGGVLPVFKSSIVFNGTTYTGDTARTKKDAEHSAAHAAILSIMGDSSSGTMLIEMIKSKSKVFDAIKGNLSLVHPSAVLSTANAGHISVTSDHQDTGIAGSVVDNINNEAKVEFPMSSEMLSTCQEFQTPKQISSPEAAKVSLQPGSENSIDDGSTSKKRRKNKKKASKKLRLESQLPVDAVHMNQAPSCSVSR